MIVLLDTSTPVCVLTMVEGEAQRQVTWHADRSLAHGILSFLQQNTGGIQYIRAIGVMRGPGSFTGLRIGLTVANTIAAEQHIPIVGEVGAEWQARCLARLDRGETDHIVLPVYGADARITRPRK